MKYKNKTIQKRPNGNTWWTRIRINGKQHTISGKTQQECYNKLKEFYKQNSNTIEKHKTYTFEIWKQEWLNIYKKDIKQTTIKTYKSMNNHLKSIMNINIKNISQIKLIETLNNITATRQRQKVYEYLVDIFDKAEKNKIINYNPMITIPKPTHETYIARALTKDEEERFINSANNNPHGDLFLVALFQGLRKGEVCALKYNDIDLENNTLRIDESLNDGTTETNTKNKQSQRTMPLFDRTKEILLKYKNKNTNTYIFKNTRGIIYKNLNKILDDAKIPHIKMHELRHTFITRCQDLNIPEHIIQSWVGHQIGSKVTKRIYTHLTEESSNKNANIINEIYNKNKN